MAVRAIRQHGNGEGCGRASGSLAVFVVIARLLLRQTIEGGGVDGGVHCENTTGYALRNSSRTQRLVHR